jgi:hypothetical protein
VAQAKSGYITEKTKKNLLAKWLRPSLGILRKKKKKKKKKKIKKKPI